MLIHHQMLIARLFIDFFANDFKNCPYLSCVIKYGPANKSLSSSEAKYHSTNAIKSSTFENAFVANKIDLTNPIYLKSCE